MKKFLIPTDFSEHAERATHFALELALVSNAACTFVHAYETPYDFAAQMENRVVAMKNNAEEKLGKLVHQFKNEARYGSLQFDFKVEEGSPERVVTDVAEETGTDLIVIGLSRENKWGAFMADNTGVEVIERSRIPVLAIPPGASYTIPREIVYAAEYREEDIQNLEDLSHWAKLFSARLRVIHIEKESTREEKMRFRGFSEEVTDRLSYPYVTQELIKADDVEEGILGATSAQEGIMLSMAHYHKSFLKSIFGRSHTRAVAMETNVPLMVFFETED